VLELELEESELVDVPLVVVEESELVEESEDIVVTSVDVKLELKESEVVDVTLVVVEEPLVVVLVALVVVWQVDRGSARSKEISSKLMIIDPDVAGPNRHW